MRLLILSYDFPPNPSIGGQRPEGWHRYLHRLGIRPTVLTRHWDTVASADDLLRPSAVQQVTVEKDDGGTVVRVPFRPGLRDRLLLEGRLPLLRRLLTLAELLGAPLLPWLDSKHFLYAQARELLRNGEFDAIIATGEPFILFTHAKRLSKEFGVPWAADYRDGWSTNYYALATGGWLNRLIHRHWLRRIEQRTVVTASLVTVAAPALVEELQVIVPGLQPEVLLNGFFHERMERLPGRQAGTRPFTIAHAGTVYPYQRLELFLEGFELFVSKHGLGPGDVQAVFLGIGAQPLQLQRLMDARPGVRAYLRTTERLGAAEALLEMHRADALLLLANAAYPQIYAKVYDYIALGLPVLLCEDDRGPLRELLDGYSSPLPANSPAEVAEALGRIRQGGSGQASLAGADHPLSRLRGAERLAGWLHQVRWAAPIVDG